MKTRLKQLVYSVARLVGLFALARTITRRELRILAYHGFAQGDELQFRPKLFISARTFKQRLSCLRRRGCLLISLDEAVVALRRGELPQGGVVVTIDDGYAATETIAAPLLREFDCPATVYVTSYHAEKRTPVFDLVVGYMLWRSAGKLVKLPHSGGETQFDLTSQAMRDAALLRVLDLGRSSQNESERTDLCRRLGQACGVSYEEIVSRGTFDLMTPEAIARLAKSGISIGLHTHRHRFPPGNLSECERELSDNQERLSTWGAQPTRHFCYPSGIYSPEQWQLLERFGILSSTTCETGSVRVGDPPHGLKRFLDGEMVSDIEFDAEICGFAELVRRGARLLKGIRGGSSLVTR